MNEEELKKVINLSKKMLPFIVEHGPEVFLAANMLNLVAVSQFNNIKKEEAVHYLIDSWDELQKQKDQFSLAIELINSVLEKESDEK